jgi:CopG family nickel-responsive transcriptional regulator
VGTITLIYNHHQRGLSDRMNQIQHDYHCLFKSNLHLHLNRVFCLEVIVVEGLQSKLKKISSKLIALKGVKHGKLTVTKIEGVAN